MYVNEMAFIIYKFASIAGYERYSSFISLSDVSVNEYASLLRKNVSIDYGISALCLRLGQLWMAQAWVEWTCLSKAW